MGRPFRLESYQSLGDLRLTFEHEGTPADYRFELDIDSAIARVSYRLGAVRYTREVFVSHPAQAIVMRISADVPAKVSVSTWIDRQQDATTEVAGHDRVLEQDMLREGNPDDEGRIALADVDPAAALAGGVAGDGRIDDGKCAGG